MGVMTGMMGGIILDILSNEPPVIFQSSLYATVSWGGSLLFIGLIYLQFDVTFSAILTEVSIFITRMIVIHFYISLAKFRFKPKKECLTY